MICNFFFFHMKYLFNTKLKILGLHFWPGTNLLVNKCWSWWKLSSLISLLFAFIALFIQMFTIILVTSVYTFFPFLEVGGGGYFRVGRGTSHPWVGLGWIGSGRVQ